MSKPKKVTAAVASIQSFAIAEKQELDVKIAKYEEILRVSTLMNSVSKEGFDDETVLELLEQLVPMREYSAALQRRIDRF